MFPQSEMIDTATGASPPWSRTREMASSPIRFEPAIDLTQSHDCIAYPTIVDRTPGRTRTAGNGRFQ